MIDDTNEETVIDETVEDTTEEVATAPAASLTVQDLANIRNIIDVASQRGAFRTNEFTSVGATYTKLNDFINAITPAQEAPAEETATEDEAVTEE